MTIMSRYSDQHKDETKKQILLAAEVIWKSKGSTSVTVEKVMSEVGLTVGGFYGHFKSKEHLLAETLKFSLSKAYLRMFRDIEKKSGQNWLNAIVTRYMNLANHADLKTACPLPFLTPELARSKSKLKRDFADELSALLDCVLNQAPGSTPSSKKAKTLAILSCCMGAVVMAQALEGSPLAKEMIDEVEGLLKG
jgi:TetR/AcrR family transcriptional regulator, transcriptional repressor for nem operon